MRPHGRRWRGSSCAWPAGARRTRARRGDQGEPGRRQFVGDLVGSVASLLGDQKTAQHWYARAHRQHPDRPAFAINHASALIFLGETEKARHDPRSDHRPAPRCGAGGMAALVDRQGGEPRARRRLDGPRGRRAGRIFASVSRIRRRQGIRGCRGVGRRLRRIRCGREAKRSTLDYDEQAEIDAFARITKPLMNAGRLRRATARGDPAPIFVVGQPRTGTTLIERIITSHSMAESAGELKQFGLSVRRLSKSALSERWSAEGVRASAGVDTQALGENISASRSRCATAPRVSSTSCPATILLHPPDPCGAAGRAHCPPERARRWTPASPVSNSFSPRPIITPTTSLKWRAITSAIAA